MERLGRVPDEILSSIGQNDIKYSRFDEQLILDKLNKNIDKQQKKFNSS